MSPKIAYAGLLLLSSLISAVSQVLLKKAAMKPHESRLKEYLNAPVIIAYAIFFLATLMTMLSYRGLDVSVGALLETTGYIFIFVFDVLLFHQKITAKKVLGTLLIMAGISVTVLL